jgi:hypothetical protein
MKHGDALSPLLCNFALDYAIRNIQEIQEGMELNEICRLLVFADSRKKLNNVELHNLYASPNIMKVIQSRRMR